MTIRGGRVALGPQESVFMDLNIRRGRVHTSMSKTQVRGALDLSGCLILPGLINAHDHLEFNLFHRLGSRTYDNATIWAEDIYHPMEAPIRQQLEVPKAIRLLWGGIKNLLNGVTAVSHHNPYNGAVFNHDFPVRVIKRFGWAHSLRFCSDLDERFSRTPLGAPFIIHAAEGTDDLARTEISELYQRNLLGPSTVLVHAVAADASDIPLIKDSGASIVWCPSSNCFTLGRTLAPEILDSGIAVALGSDSSLTAEGDFFDELRFASTYTTVTRLYRMVTTEAARILGLSEGTGIIRDDGIADLVVVADQGQTPAEAIVSCKPELVMIGGRIKLISVNMASRLNYRALAGFEELHIERRGRYFVKAPITALKEQTVRYLGDHFRLAGKQVLM
jgi:cytosine/adenosine deaminase-related metal-dependent hydrolase